MAFADIHELLYFLNNRIFLFYISDEVSIHIRFH